ncbi:hypothetical protein [Spiroplasma endosymbiont of Crioceris asparagi]|uniref:hypothetical protein n=1 Tax=Spiroplasma endosymbiont of Crioceris asparagi TaxID=3066286 RepID=UPI0030D46AB9
MDIQIKSPLNKNNDPKISEQYDFVGLDVIFFDYKFNVDGKEFYKFYFRPNYRCDASYGVETLNPYLTSFALNTNDGLKTLKNDITNKNYWITKEQTTSCMDFYGTQYWECAKIPIKDLNDSKINLEYKLQNQESGNVFNGKLTLNTNKQINRTKLKPGEKYGWKVPGVISLFVKWSNESEEGVCYSLVDEQFKFLNVLDDYSFQLNKKFLFKKFQCYFDTKHNPELLSLINAFLNEGIAKNNITKFNFNDNEDKKYYEIIKPELEINKVKSNYQYNLKFKTKFDFSKKLVKTDKDGENGIIRNPYFKGKVDLTYEIDIDDILFAFTKNWIEDKEIDKMFLKTENKKNLINSKFIKWKLKDIDKIKKFTFKEFEDYFNE